MKKELSMPLVLVRVALSLSGKPGFDSCHTPPPSSSVGVTTQLTCSMIRFHSFLLSAFFECQNFHNLLDLASSQFILGLSVGLNAMYKVVQI